MNEFEQRVMEMLLAGDHLYLGTLRVQLDAAAVTAREHTGVGFFTSFAAPDDCLRLPAGQGRCTISDVFGEAEGVEHGVGFIQFIENGALNTLECYIFGTERLDPGAWLNRVYYMRRSGDTASLIECPVRDLAFALPPTV